jgi:DNA-binding MarR family transcriptional regulator
LFKEFNEVQVRNSQFEKSLLNQIARVSNGLEREVENELKVSFKLTFSQFRVLNGLLALGEASGRELATSLEVTPAVVTRQIEALGSRGLLTVKANPRSKRENVLSLTPKGDEAVRDASKVIEDRQKLIFAKLSVKDEVAFQRGIEALGRALS